MPVLHQLQPSFNNGEISPLLYDRVDFQKFVSSVKSGKNMFVHPQGGMSNRAGTVMLAQAKDSNVRLIPFEFSSTETYVIEFGNGYCRFFTSNGQVVVEEEIDGQTVQVPYEIQSPFTTADLPKIRYCQSGDVMYIAWGGKPKTLQRFGHTNWIFADYDYKNGPFELENTNSENLLFIKWNTDTSNYKISSSFENFSQTDVGRLIATRRAFNASHFSAVVSSTGYTTGNSLCSGQYEFHTKGTWTGTIKIQYSKDFVSWKSEREFSGYNNINFDYTGELEEGLWWVRIVADITSGSLTFTFDTQSFEEQIVFRISSYSSSIEVYADYIGDVIGLENVFFQGSSGSPSGEIVSLIPVMTSNTSPSGEAYSTSFGVNAWRIFAGGWLDAPTQYTGQGYSVGYKPASDYYVYNIEISTFFGGATGGFGPSRFEDFFDYFYVSYSLDNSTKVRINYSVSIVSSGPASITRFKLSFAQPVLLDDLFFEYFIKTSTVHAYAVVGEARAFGIESSGGEDSYSDRIEKFSLGLWSNTTGFSTEVDLYQDRIVWATNNQIDATKISDYTNFGVSTDVTEDDAISVIVKDKKVDKINSIVSGTKLAVYSDDGNFVHNNDTFTPNSATFLKQGATGGSEVKPVVVRDHIIYAHPMKQAISDYAYNFETDGYAGQDITLLANHLFDGKVIKTLAYQQEPYSIIWVLQEEGTVLACTYLRQQNVIAWTPMDFGGVVKSIAVCSYGTKEELYLAVQRTNGTFVEKMPTRLLNSDPKECFFVDCGRTYRGDPATVISGLNYLEGEDVVALADGNVIKGLTVENGEITLPIPASVVTVGLPYESVLETLTFDVNTGDGSHLNRKKRVVAVSIRYNNSRGSKVSVNGHREIDMLIREQEGYNIPISLKSGVYRAILPSAHDEKTNIKIRQNDPLPITIVSVIPEIEYEK